MNTKASDHPLEVVSKSCRELTSKGGFFLQKWTCAHCGARVAANTLNTICHIGHHDDCGHDTDLNVAGCNFMDILSTQSAEEVAQAMGLLLPADMGPTQGGVQ